MKSQAVFGTVFQRVSAMAKRGHPGKEIMQQIIPISPFQTDAFVVELRNIVANETRPEGSQPVKGRRRSAIIIGSRVARSALVCILNLIVFSACSSMRNHVSGRSWSQIAGQEQQEQENANAD